MRVIPSYKGQVVGVREVMDGPPVNNMEQVYAMFQRDCGYAGWSSPVEEIQAVVLAAVDENKVWHQIRYENEQVRLRAYLDKWFWQRSWLCLYGKNPVKPIPAPTRQEILNAYIDMFCIFGRWMQAKEHSHLGESHFTETIGICKSLIESLRQLKLSQ